jgi:hypothetical protein
MNTRRYLHAAPFRRGRLLAERMFRKPANGVRPLGNYLQRTRAHPGAILAACLWIACASGIKVQANERSVVTGNGYVTFFVLLGTSSGSTTVDPELSHFTSRMMEQLRLKTSAELVTFAVRQGVVA